MYIVFAILAFSFIVIIHELGHFTLAKLNGVKVEQFSLGMGPKLLGVKFGETEYLIKALPIGGYVKMLGDEGSSNDTRAFNNKKPLQKLSIVAAGPIMNIILAIVLFAVVGGVKGFVTTTLSGVIPNQPADIAGLKAGDTIKKVNGHKVLMWQDLGVQITSAAGKSVSVTIDRAGEAKTIMLTPVKDEKENRLIIGVYPGEVKNPTFFQAIDYSLKESQSLTMMTFDFFKNLIKGKVSKNDVGGPISVIKVTSEAAKNGIFTLMFIGGFLSIQLGIFNIIPFPALDGGYIIIFLFELITGKKVDENKVGFVNYIGFAILMGLMILVTVKDILYPISI